MYRVKMNHFSILIIACAIFSLCSAKSGIVCKPGTIFNNDCNICICGLTGLDYKCSEEKCYSKTNKENLFKDEYDNDYYIDLSNENYDDNDYVNEKKNKQVASEAVDMENDTNDINDERLDTDGATNDIDDERFDFHDAINDNNVNNELYDVQDKDLYPRVKDLYPDDKGTNNEEDSYDDFNELRLRAWDKILKR